MKLWTAMYTGLLTLNPESSYKAT